MKELFILLAGNTLGLIGSVFMVLANNSKDPRNVAKLQNVQVFMLGLSNLVLGAFTGFLSSIISIVRNVLCLKGKMNNVIKALLLLTFVGTTLAFNTIGWVGWLPTIASATITLGMGAENQRFFRTCLLVASITFAIFDFCVKNYVTCVFDIATIYVSVVQLLMTFKWTTSKQEDTLPKKCA